ncbi:MAG: acyltransferase [Hyphomicrobiales bacterium]
MRGPLLASLLEKNNNNFNLLRFLAAASVIVSHAWLATGGESVAEPLLGPTPFTLGQHAVLVFFSLSGFLVAASLHRSRSTRDFLKARALRVYPGLIACLALITFVLGPAVTTHSVGDYATDPGTYAYFAKSMTLLAGTFPLPGVFEGNPYPGVVDLPIWTLKYEIACYVLLAVLGGLGLFRKVAVIWSIFTLAVIAYLAILVLPDLAVLPKTAYHLSRLIATFFLGVLGWHYRHEIRLSASFLALAIGAVVLCHGTPLAELSWVVLDAYGAMCFTAIPLGALRQATNRIDISYGLYIYGWTVEQTIVNALPAFGPASVAVLAVFITTALAWLSWTLVEHPALALKRPAQARTTIVPAA